MNKKECTKSVQLKKQRCTFVYIAAFLIDT